MCNEHFKIESFLSSNNILKSLYTTPESLKEKYKKKKTKKKKGISESLFRDCKSSHKNRQAFFSAESDMSRYVNEW